MSLEQVAICERCGETFSNKTIKQHMSVCDRIPTSDELCDILDRQPDLSVEALSKKLGCSYGFLSRRLVGTRWDRRRLRKRGNKCKSLVQRQRPGPTVAGPTCRRCGVLLSQIDGPVIARLCYHCRYELKAIARRLITGGFFGYALNKRDVEWFRCYNPEELQLL